MQRWLEVGGFAVLDIEDVVAVWEDSKCGLQIHLKSSREISWYFNTKTVPSVPNGDERHRIYKIISEALLARRMEC